MTDINGLELLFATVATIVATLTGLIGAFSTFRLENISTEINFLKGFVLEKKGNGPKTLNDHIKGEDYHLLEKIYDRTKEGVDTLEMVIKSNGLEHQTNEFSFDLQNIRKNQTRYDNIKDMTTRSFFLSLLFVFANLVFLFFTAGMARIPGFHLYSIIYFLILAMTFYLFIGQIRFLIR